MGISKLGHRKQIIRERDLITAASVPAVVTESSRSTDKVTQSLQRPSSPMEPQFPATLIAALELNELVFNFGSFPTTSPTTAPTTGDLLQQVLTSTSPTTAASASFSSSLPAAVVEDSAIKSHLQIVQDSGPVPHFVTLSQQTNLNAPSPNWLHHDERLETSDAEKALPGLSAQGAVTQLGVQFVGNSDDIKALFKAPFSKSPSLSPSQVIGIVFADF